MKKCIALLAALLLLLTGCSSAATETVPTTAATESADGTGPAIKPRNEINIYISLPDDTVPQWSEAGSDLQMLLENLSYNVTLAYAGADAQEQSLQLTQAIEEGADCLIVAAVDSAALTQVGELALEKNIALIAYDRLIVDTEAVSYYVSYNYTAMGTAMGEHIVAQKGLDSLEEGQSLTIEFFMGSPEDSSAHAVYTGLMQVLQPYLEKGTLVSNTGRTAFEDTCVVDYDAARVTKSLTGYLSEFYRHGAPDILCTVSDSFADACIAVMAETKPDATPLITGLGGFEMGFSHILEGKQSMTVATDQYLLNEKCVALTDALLTGKVPEVNDTETCHNNAYIVPAYLCDFELITEGNVP